MADLNDGESVEVKGSGSAMYQLKNTGGVFSCSCPAWRNQSLAIEKRSCKHLRAYRGTEAEEARVGAALPRRPTAKASNGSGSGPSEVKAVEGPPILLAHRWENDIDLDGWWMSEKLDGVRAYWDGKVFLSRLGNVYMAPAWFVAQLPDVPLDGELWCGRKAFQKTTSIVRRQDQSKQWEQVRYVIFDAPATPGPFEERMEFCRRSLAERQPPYASWHEHQRCNGLVHLQSELERVEALGGEGLMLRQPGSHYQVGRSSTLLKVKTFHDSEATVVEHLAGAGRHLGRLGALLVALPDGTRFSVGSGFSDAEREAPPPVGSVITFRYQELSDGGVPRFPTYVGVRIDVALPAPPPERPASPPPGSFPYPPSVPLPSPVAIPRVAPARAAPATRSEASSGSCRRFEFVGDGSGKYWEIEVSGNSHTVRFGRIGTEGQRKTKTFADGPAAARDAAKLVEEKTRKGYREKPPNG